MLVHIPLTLNLQQILSIMVMIILDDLPTILMHIPLTLDLQQILSIMVKIILNEHSTTLMHIPLALSPLVIMSKLTSDCQFSLSQSSLVESSCTMTIQTIIETSIMRMKMTTTSSPMISLPPPIKVATMKLTLTYEGKRHTDLQCSIIALQGTIHLMTTSTPALSVLSRLYTPVTSWKMPMASQSSHTLKRIWDSLVSKSALLNYSHLRKSRKYLNWRKGHARLSHILHGEFHLEATQPLQRMVDLALQRIQLEVILQMEGAKMHSHFSLMVILFELVPPKLVSVPYDFYFVITFMTSMCMPYVHALVHHC